MNKSIFLLLVVSLITIPFNNAHSQVSYGDLNRKIIPAAPNAASLLKFNEIPVSYFNGTANVSIPLHRIQNGSTDLPLQLTYHTGGIKVQEEASWVGLGWNLPIGGVIQEIVVGEPDIIAGAPIGIANSTPIGNNDPPRPNSSVSTPWNTPEAYNVDEAGLCYRNSSGQVVQYTRSQIYRSNYEYDLYSFNFMGYSGKFIMPDLQNGACLDRQNIRFSRPISGQSVTVPITATTPDGTKYLFEVIGFSNSATAPVGFDPVIKPRTYYLSKIIYPDGSEVTLNYVSTTSRTLPSISESWSQIQLEQAYQAIVGPPAPTHRVTSDFSYVDNYYLDEIVFTNGKIKFVTSTRQDMENAKKLDKIQIFQYGDASTPIKEIKFTYDYFIGSGDDWITNTTVRGRITGSFYEPAEDFKTKRLKLTKVEISDGTTTLPPYSLDYGGPQLPPKTSLAQDLWGFYNGIANNTSLLPDYDNLGYWDGDIPYTFLNSYNKPALGRRVTTSFDQAGTLKRITYPTGGYSMFEYEDNQIANLNSSTQSVGDAIATAQDISTGIQQVQFTVPDVGFHVQDPFYRSVNPSTLYVNLFCCGYNAFTSDGYFNCPGSTGSPCDAYLSSGGNGLYAKLEYLNDQTQQWSTIEIFDIANAQIRAAHGSLTRQMALTPGTYRITANFPDALAPGVYGDRYAFIQMKYKVFEEVNNVTPVPGGGLRIKNIVDYTYSNAAAITRNFTYSPGILMTRPLFYRIQTEEGVFSSLSAGGCNYSQYAGESNCPSGMCPLIEHTIYSLYSNPVASYSYSASGGLVGYEKVTITADENSTTGKEEYSYYCIPDHWSSYYAFEMPGIPTSPDFYNGMVQKHTVFKKSGTSFLPVKETEFQYTLQNLETKWCYKSEYNPEYYPNCSGGTENICSGILESIRTSPLRIILHFYPLKFGKLNVTQKTERSYEGTDVLTSVTSYEYNSKLQLRSTATTDSKGQTLASETYYPFDYTTTSDITKEMRDRNMVDYPIEQISKVNGLAIKALYNEYYLHDNMVSLNKIYTLNNATPALLTPSVPSNSRNNQYQHEITLTYNAAGNIITQQKVNDVKKSYLWGYNATLPVAEVINADVKDVYYTSFEDGTGNSSIGDGKTGKKSSITGLSVSLSNLTNGDYLLTYWKKEGGTWTFYRSNVSVAANAYSISLAGQVDEVRFYPKAAMMTTSTYEPLIGMTSQCDVNNRILYYEYDSFQRLKLIRDQDGKILKTFEYKYQQQQ